MRPVVLFGILWLVAQNRDEIEETDRRFLAWLGMTPMTPAPKPAAPTFEELLAELGLVPLPATARTSTVSEATSERRGDDGGEQFVELRPAAPAQERPAASSDVWRSAAPKPVEEVIEPVRDEVPRHWFREEVGAAPVPSSSRDATPAPVTTPQEIPAPRSRWKLALQIGGTIGTAALLVWVIGRRFGELRRLHELTAAELAAAKMELDTLQKRIRGDPSTDEAMRAYLDKCERELEREFARIDEAHRSD